MELHFVQLSLCNRYSVIFLPDPKSGETRNVGDNQNTRSDRGVISFEQFCNFLKKVVIMVIIYLFDYLMWVGQFNNYLDIFMVFEQFCNFISCSIKKKIWFILLSSRVTSRCFPLFLKWKYWIRIEIVSVFYCVNRKYNLFKWILQVHFNFLK